MTALLAAWLAAVPAAGQPRVAVVMEKGSADSEAVVDEIRAAAGGDANVAVVELPPGDPVDPIARGRLLSSLQGSDLVVTVADRPTEFVLKEREDVPVYFIGAASLLRGRDLTASDVAGILPYNAEETLDLVHALGLTPLGLIYTEGFAPVAEAIAAGAGARGLEVVREVIGARGDVGPAVRKLTGRARVVWVLGDPLLTRGAGFDFLIEQSLAARVPVVAPARWEGVRGALVSFQPAWSALAAAAMDGVRAALARQPRPDRVAQAPAGGTFLLNRTLADKWDIAVPAGTRWRPVR